MTDITITDDFDPGKIAASGQCFRAAAVGDGWRFITGDDVVCLTPRSAQGWTVDCTRDTWQRVWTPYFDLDRSYAAIRAALPPQDAYLRAAAACGQGIRVLRQDPWEMLVTFIISQRKSIPAIRGCVEALCTRFGTPLQTQQGGVHAFPTSQTLCAEGLEALSACGLGYRAPYVLDAARRVASGALDLQALAALSDQALLQQLMTVYGVGKKVANCVALFAYGRVGCAPIDVWIERVIEQEYRGQNPFPGYGNAGILQQYMFYDAQQRKRARRGA